MSRETKTKYIFITGGVVSSLGKGITAASLGRLLKERGYKITIQKFDPYINVDPGTMNPYEHGEVFVTEDGAETDLDLGHYERFIDENLMKNSNITTGKIYQTVISNEREGKYLGKTVQVIPHITNEIKNKLKSISIESGADIVITEIGGTVGDIESTPFLEAIRQFKYDIGEENVIYIHVTLLPYLKSAKEIKTKPAQHSVKELMSLGIKPDILVCRTEFKLTKEIKEKISMFCNIDINCVIENLDVETIYELPLKLEEQNFSEVVCKKLNLNPRIINLDLWKEIVYKIKYPKEKIKIAVVGKYVELKDAYISITESLKNAGYFKGYEVNIDYIQAEGLDTNILKGYNGILIPGGFGNRGIEGKISAIKYARENKIPFLGICLGMQLAVIEFARNILKLKANSTEFDEKTPAPVIDILPEQKNISNKGGTMRLGGYPCILKDNSLAKELYNKDNIIERHRHRYEFNNDFKEIIEEKGLKISGTSPNGILTEIVELSKEIHPFYIAVQFHPEFKTRLNNPHPLFLGFVEASYKYSLNNK
ncbi:MAG: CTP synthase [Fusobacterium perfoetens]|uniref:CTP synthase n=1 Tax=Fusobacterium perfoetens TaxID=852 RepID=UPI0023F03CF2|nr:CTP synthase [Fusobacterium perfoetens]MCI6153139.1 CTP synthase [Fusobacterium perfoetens]MDY3237069.1 CTP synthase [Fusobacterium perfoetens]